MRQWKKALSGLLMVGLLSTGGASLALADEQSGAREPGGHRGGMLEKSDFLSEQIAGLSEEQQAEITALWEQLAQLKPQRPEQMALSDEQKALLDDYQSQMQALEEAIRTVFIEAGVTLEKPERGERPEGLPEPPDGEAPELPAENGLPPLNDETDGAAKDIPAGSEADGQRPDGAPGGPRGGRSGMGGGLKITEDALAQLDSAAQAQVQSLQQQLETLRQEQRTALGLTSEADEDRADEEANRADIQALEQSLREALTAAGIEWPSPEARKTDQ